jgi:hypothetical protein
MKNYYSHRHCDIPSLKYCKQEKQEGEISGSHSSEYEDDCLLGCCAMYPGDISEVLGASEISVNFYQTAQRNIPEDSNLKTGRDQTESTLTKLM